MLCAPITMMSVYTYAKVKLCSLVSVKRHDHMSWHKHCSTNSFDNVWKCKLQTYLTENPIQCDVCITWYFTISTIHDYHNVNLFGPYQDAPSAFYSVQIVPCANNTKGRNLTIFLNNISYHGHANGELCTYYWYSQLMIPYPLLD